MIGGTASFGKAEALSSLPRLMRTLQRGALAAG